MIIVATAMIVTARNSVFFKQDLLGKDTTYMHFPCQVYWQVTALALAQPRNLDCGARTTADFKGMEKNWRARSDILALLEIIVAKLAQGWRGDWCGDSRNFLHRARDSCGRLEGPGVRRAGIGAKEPLSGGSGAW
jgi:hypothetical protein